VRLVVRGRSIIELHGDQRIVAMRRCGHHQVPGSEDVLSAAEYLLDHVRVLRLGCVAERAEYRRNYVPAHSGPPSGAGLDSSATTAERLQSLADARDRGAISDQEFEVEKAKILT
jgi:hypothetical protein